MSEIIERRGNNNTGAVCDGGKSRQVKQVPLLESTSARDLAKEDIAPLEYIINNLLPALGLGMLGAPPKSKKSWLCIDIGICVSSGFKFLGYETKKCDVLYLDLESTKRRPRDRINLMTENAPPNFHIITGEQPVGKIGEGLEEQLADQLNKHSNIGLIIIDVLKRIRPVQKRGMSDYDRDYEDLGALKRFADAHGVCILVVHHTRKMKDPDDPFNELAGSAGVLGVLDAAFVISKKKRDDKEATLYVTGRDTDQQALKIQFNSTTLRWENLGDAEEVEHNRLINEYKNSKVVNVVKRLLEQSNGEITYSAKELIDASQYIGSGMFKIYDTSQKVGMDLSKYTKLFEEIDNIKAVKKEKDSKGNIPWIFYNILSDYP